MSKVCDICGKKPSSGNFRTFSNKANKRMFKPNIVKRYLDIGGIKIKVNICSRCYKKLKK